MTKLWFLLANRRLNWFPSSFSISASWIWVPAFFVSCQKAFTEGWVGLFWFTVPNVLCLILFAYFAERMRQKYPYGFTLSAYMERVYSKRVQSLYWVSLIGLTVCAFAVQLMAGGKMVSFLTGIPYEYSVLILALVPLSYTLFFGLKGSVVTDFIKMIIVLTGLLIITPMVVSYVGWDTVLLGMHGQKGNINDLFDSNGINILLAFGLPVTIGLLSGPFGDQSFWQRAFAIEDIHHIKKSFITGAFIFAIVPLCMGIIGFAAAGQGLSITDVQMVNIETVQQLLPTWSLYIFLGVLLAGIISVLDSKLSSVSSIAGHDMSKRFFKDEHSLFLSRASMFVLAFLAIGIAFIPGLKILHLFLFYGTIRAVTFLPTVITLLSEHERESGVFYGILAGIVIGLPVFAYGSLTGSTNIALCGSVFSVLAPGIIILINTRLPRQS